MHPAQLSRLQSLLTAPLSSRAERRALHWPVWTWAGVAIFSFGLVTLWADIPDWNLLWYIPAWFGYLVCIDAAIFRLQGESFLSHRRRELLSMMGWSIPFWLLFEFYNFRVQNWYYVYTPLGYDVQIVMTVMAFGTVFPACFFHAELLKAMGCWRNAWHRPVDVEAFWLPFFRVLGALCIVLPWIAPRQTYWMLWGVTLGIPDAINYRSGAPSLLRDLKAGRPGRIYRLLAGGLIAGFVWESMNYWARCKWIYTVPGLEEWKWFEMPVAGFIGFPVLSVEAFAGYSLLCHWIRGGRSWEHSDTQAARSIDPLRWWACVIVATVFSFGVSEYAWLSVQSSQGFVYELDGYEDVDRQFLQQRGIHTPEQLVREADRGRGAAFRNGGIDEARLNRMLNHARLCLHKGMGTEASQMLVELGINTVADLRDQDAETLLLKLQLRAEVDDFHPPTLAQVKVWLRAARYAETPQR